MPAEVETMMSVRQVPWHRLGVVLDDYPSDPVAAMQAASLDWTVELAPVYYRNDDGSFDEVASSKMTYRTSDRRPLGIVGNRYTPIQNQAMFEFCDALLDTGDVKFETAGSLRNGRWVWALAKIDRPIKVAGDDVLPYLLVTNGHDGLQSFAARVTPTRVVCANTLHMAIANARSKWTIRHTSSWESKVDEARVTLGLSYQYFDGFEQEVARLIDTDVTERKFNSIMSRLIPFSENERSETMRQTSRDEIKSIYTSPTCAEFVGTGWGTLNAVSEWELWGRPRENASMFETQARKILREKATPLTTRAHRMLVAK